MESKAKCKIGHFLMSDGPLYIKCCSGAQLTIGNKCFFNHNCSITSKEKIEIGNNCMFANNLVIVDHNHKMDSQGFIDGFETAPIHIGNGVWCGANVTILKGVTVGNGAVVAAGAVVAKDIPPFEVWGGVPARCIRKLNNR